MLGTAANSTGKPSEERPGTLLFRISGVSTGLPLSSISQYPKEGEHLLGPCTLLRIDAVTEDSRNPFGHGLILDATCLGPLGASLSSSPELSAFFCRVRSECAAACEQLIHGLLRKRAEVPRERMLHELGCSETRERALLAQLAEVETASLSMSMQLTAAVAEADRRAKEEETAREHARRRMLVAEERHVQELKEYTQVVSPPRRAEWWVGSRVEARFGPFVRWFQGTVTQTEPLTVRLDCDREKLHSGLEVRPLAESSMPEAAPEAGTDDHLRPAALPETIVSSPEEEPAFLPTVGSVSLPGGFDIDCPWTELTVGQPVRARWRYGSWFQGVVAVAGPPASAVTVRIGASEFKGLYAVVPLVDGPEEPTRAASFEYQPPSRAPTWRLHADGQPDATLDTVLTAASAVPQSEHPSKSQHSSPGVSSLSVSVGALGTASGPFLSSTLQRSNSVRLSRAVSTATRQTQPLGQDAADRGDSQSDGSCCSPPPGSPPALPLVPRKQEAAAEEAEQGPRDTVTLEEDVLVDVFDEVTETTDQRDPDSSFVTSNRRSLASGSISAGGRSRARTRRHRVIEGSPRDRARVRAIFDRFERGGAERWFYGDAQRYIAVTGGCPLTEEEWEQECWSLGVDPAEGLAVDLLAKAYARLGDGSSQAISSDFHQVRARPIQLQGLKVLAGEARRTSILAFFQRWEAWTEERRNERRQRYRLFQPTSRRLSSTWDSRAWEEESVHTVVSMSPIDGALLFVPPPDASLNLDR
eukprot:TRINITY_DN6630_c1_g1_i1.p1 TRINITY_DN6630_c1_g1~~TRINITY_DN6630_c1_g1_i1.p1  ORF type:complete len:757 (+),score=155.56 TRINITY_DN6630_c1_g1_i1:1506-3776(+)